MTYRERPTPVPGVALWARDGAPGPTTILPDGCLDLVLAGDALVVAGPDSAARIHHDPAVRRHVGLRFAHGRGPAFLGCPADAVLDARPDLAALWGDRAARALAARVVDDPVGALLGWLAAGDRPVDPFGARVVAALDAGLSVAALADRLGVTTRTLHRRSRGAFGYGPQHLARVLRLQRALAAARRGRPWAAVAADVGYADQPHLAREVRALAGTTPSALLADRRAQDPSGAIRSTGTPSGSWTTA